MSSQDIKQAYMWFLVLRAKLMLMEEYKCVYFRNRRNPDVSPAINGVGGIRVFEYGLFKPHKLVEE